MHYIFNLIFLFGLLFIFTQQLKKINAAYSKSKSGVYLHIIMFPVFFVNAWNNN